MTWHNKGPVSRLIPRGNKTNLIQIQISSTKKAFYYDNIIIIANLLKECEDKRRMWEATEGVKETVSLDTAVTRFERA